MALFDPSSPFFPWAGLKGLNPPPPGHPALFPAFPSMGTCRGGARYKVEQESDGERGERNYGALKGREKTEGKGGGGGDGL